MQYRVATLSDVPAMATIRAAEWETEDYWRRRLAAYMDGTSQPQTALTPRITYVAVSGVAVVGFASGHLTRRFDCDGELQFLNVAASHRGAGIAAELLRRMAAWFVSQHARRICVDPDDPARRFYTRHGAVALNRHWLVWEDIAVVLSPPAGVAT